MTETRQFLLFIRHGEGVDYGVELRQAINGQSGPQEHVVVRAWGPPLQASVEQLLAAVKHSGHRPGEFVRTRTAPFELREPWGVRVGLLLLAVKPLVKPSRMEYVVAGIAAMPDEEAYYWFSKCTSRHRGLAAQKALRTLLAPE